MKKQLFTFIIAVLAFSQSAFSQEFKLKFKKDTAFIDGKPICLCKDRNAGTEYRILTLKNRELIYAKAVGVGLKAYYNLTFLDSGAKCEREMGWKFGTGLVRDLYERGALTFDSDSLNPEGLKKFLMTNDHKYSEEFKAEQKKTEREEADKAEKSAVSTSTKKRSEVKLVERNTTRRVSAGFGKIEQDFKTIGTYKEADVSVTGKKITIISADGEPIAELSFQSLSDKKGKLFIFTDREEYDFPTTRALNSDGLVEDFAKFLIDKRYL
jgi:hypothetical protein